MRYIAGGALVLAWLAVSVAAGQEFPRGTAAGNKSLDKLLSECLEAGGLKRVPDPIEIERKLLRVADRDRLQRVLRQRRGQVMPALVDALVSRWRDDDELPDDLHVTLLQMAGEAAADDRALGFSAALGAQGLLQQGDLPAALAALQQGAERFQQAGDAGWQAACINQVGIIYTQVQDHERALAAFQQALPLAEEAYGPRNSLTAAAHGNLASALSRLRRFDEALASLDRAVEILQEVLGREHPHLTNPLTTKALILSELRRHDEAQALLTEVLAIRRAAYPAGHPEIGKALDNLGEACRAAGDVRRAVEYYRQGAALFERADPQGIDLATNQAILAEALEELGQFEEALPAAQRALDIRRQLFGEQTEPVALAHSLLSGIYAGLGEYGQALEEAEQALAIRLQDERSSPFNRGVAYSRVGFALARLGRQIEALDHYKQAVEIFREVAMGQPHRDLAANLNNAARLYNDLGNRSDAIELYRAALAMQLELTGPASLDVATMQGNLGLLLLVEGEKVADRREGEELVAASLHAFRALYGEQHPEVARTLYNLGDHALAQQEYGPALRRLDEALGALFKEPIGRQQEPRTLNAAEFQVIPLTVQVLSARGRALELMAANPPEQEELQQIANTYDAAADVAAQLAQRLQTGAGKLALGEDNFLVYPLQAGAHARLFAAGGDPAELAAVFRAMEEGSARLFLESLAAARADVTAGAPPELLAERDVLQAELRRVSQLLEQANGVPFEQRDANLAAGWRAEEIVLEEELAAWTAAVEAENPVYAAWHRPVPCTLAEARACLHQDETAVVYSLGNHASWALCIEPSGVAGPGASVYELPPRHEIVELIESLVQDTARLRDADAIRPLAAELHHMLLGPLAERLADRHVLVVPSGELWSVPFELLAEGEEGPFLAETRRVRYAPSMTVLHVQRQWERARPRPTTPLWALADPIFGPADPRHAGAGQAAPEGAGPSAGTAVAALPRLVRTAGEVQQIAAALGVPDAPLLGGDATEAAVLAASASGQLAAARYVHFATHGLLSLDAGLQPALVLSQLENGTDDGLLELDEAAALRLNADLVVLSACHTARGTLYQGEGVRGLARAFLHAGSRGVVCTLWQADDASASRMMAAFYRGLQAGLPAAEALAQARRAAIAAGEPPLFWAPFVLLGE